MLRLQVNAAMLLHKRNEAWSCRHYFRLSNNPLSSSLMHRLKECEVYFVEPADSIMEGDFLIYVICVKMSMESVSF